MTKHRCMKMNGKGDKSTRENKIYNDPVVIILVLITLGLVLVLENISFIKEMSTAVYSVTILSSIGIIMTLLMGLYERTNRYKRLYGNKKKG